MAQTSPNGGRAVPRKSRGLHHGNPLLRFVRRRSGSPSGPSSGRAPAMATEMSACASSCWTPRHRP